ncbi:MAG TPA: hypothetical protein VK484_08675 [Ferruginibacter sp.]|nr:hypothetical protein [Ferruginibacter sp.]
MADGYRVPNCGNAHVVRYLIFNIMQTEHQYLDKYPIPLNSERLILGTIHPHNHERFIIPFFYGNKLSIWKILNEAFPNELGDTITLTSIIRFLETHKIAVSDTIIKCERKNPTALDEDLIPLEYNHALIEQIKKSNIKEILFTSGFQKNNAFKTFYVNILGLKITPEIRRNKKAILDASIFGRPIKLTVLFSPSGSSNVGLSKSKRYLENQEKFSGSLKPVHDFKVSYYKEAFTNQRTTKVLPQFEPISSHRPDPTN